MESEKSVWKMDKLLSLSFKSRKWFKNILKIIRKECEIDSKKVWEGLEKVRGEFYNS